MAVLRDLAAGDERVFVAVVFPLLTLWTFVAAWRHHRRYWED